MKQPTDWDRIGTWLVGALGVCVGVGMVWWWLSTVFTMLRGPGVAAAMFWYCVVVAIVLGAVKLLHDHGPAWWSGRTTR